jgi:hypothetical protein
MNSSKLILPSPSASVISNASRHSSSDKVLIEREQQGCEFPDDDPAVAVAVAAVEALAQLGELVGAEVFHC